MDCQGSWQGFVAVTPAFFAIPAILPVPPPPPLPPHIFASGTSSGTRATWQACKSLSNMRATLHQGATNTYYGQWPRVFLGKGTRFWQVHCP